MIDEQEVVQEEAVQPEDTQQEPVTPEKQPQLEESHPEKQPQRESDKDKNFRELREKVARIERERDELAVHLKKQEPAPEEDDITIGDDDIAEGKHLKKQGKRLKALEKKLEEQTKILYEQTAEARIKAQYPDFDKVVSNETLSLLRETYPELAETLNSTSNIYNKASAAYTMVKKLGLYTPDNYAQDRAQVTNNATKPRSSASVSPQQGESPLSNANAFANGLTPELKKKLYAEMLEAKKRI